jgi:hypothetical protein
MSGFDIGTAESAYWPTKGWRGVSAEPKPQRRPMVDQWLKTGLADHPKLLAELSGS